MTRVYLSFNRQNGIEVVSSNQALPAGIRTALTLKSLPLGLPPDEVLKSFPVENRGTVISYFKMLSESGLGCALVFADRRDVDPFQYETLLKGLVEEWSREARTSELRDEPRESQIPKVDIPKRFDSAIQSLITGQKIMVLGEKEAVGDMIRFLMSLIPKQFRGYFGLTLWCNSASEQGNIIGLPPSLFTKARSDMETGPLSALIDLADGNTLGRESTNFSKDIVERIEQGQIDNARYRIMRIYTVASALAAKEKRIRSDEPQIVQMVARRIFGYSGHAEQEGWMEKF